MLRGLVAAVALLTLGHEGLASEKPTLLRRVSCALVRFYVAKYSETAAETWARNHMAQQMPKLKRREDVLSAPTCKALALGTRKRRKTT